ncbi:hypothetical protein Tco_1487210 [Tanacetum coccineum]
MYDVPFRDNSLPIDISKDQFEGFSNSNDDSTSIDDDSFSIDDIDYGFSNSNDDSTSIDEDSFSIDNIDYVEASPPDSEPVNLEVVEIVIPEVGGIDTDILLTIKNDSIREKVLNVNLLIAMIEALKDNPTPSSDFMTNSGSPTSYLDLSLPDYEAFFCDSEPDSGNFTMDVVEDIFDNPTREPRVHVPNVLPTHPNLQLDLDFTLSRIFIEVQSKIFLSPNAFSISFIRDPLSLVFDTLLPFSSENKDNVFNLGILASNKEKSPHLLSHRGFKASKLFHYKSPMLIHGENIPILDVPFLYFYPS